MAPEEDKNRLLSAEEVMPVAEILDRALASLNEMLLGRPQLHKLVLIGVIARGHILLEGVPGVGKTALIRVLGEILQLQFNRIQFTPDLMPGDILGTHILQETPEGRAMRFEPGAVFCNILLADEINRASPKTQSALLEAMQECSVTLLGETRELPDPFFVLASQNPIEQEGTYPLPEAQLDRFMFKLQVLNTNAQVLEQIITTRRRGETPESSYQLCEADLKKVYDVMDRIFLPRAVARYIARLSAATHAGDAEATDMVKKYVNYGASPRAAIAIAEAARACALIAGRPTVGFEDVRAVATPVLNHRVLLNYNARFDKIDSAAVIESLLETMDESGLDLPDDIGVA